MRKVSNVFVSVVLYVSVIVCHPSMSLSFDSNEKEILSINRLVDKYFTADSIVKHHILDSLIDKKLTIANYVHSKIYNLDKTISFYFAKNIGQTSGYADLDSISRFFVEEQEIEWGGVVIILYQMRISGNLNNKSNLVSTNILKVLIEGVKDSSSYYVNKSNPDSPTKVRDLALFEIGFWTGYQDMSLVSIIISNSGPIEDEEKSKQFYKKLTEWYNKSNQAILWDPNQKIFIRK